ncbi:DUF4386 domain-containing protein [Maribrevibacterium harenarium]|nr:DUF4386 domain-containing protein [Maribrevibacterium harenarium]
MSTNFVTIQKDARIAGMLYLLLIPLGVMGILYIPDMLLGGLPPAGMFAVLQVNGDALRLSIFCALLIQMVQMPLAYYLYKVLRPASEFYARLIIICVAFAVPIALVNELFSFAALLLTTEPELFSQFTHGQQVQMLALLLKLHEGGIMIAHIFWGLWLLPLGYAIIKAAYLPSFIGYLLLLAGVGYLADTGIWILLPEMEPMVADYTFIGEVILPLWLLIRGVKPLKAGL